MNGSPSYDPWGRYRPSVEDHFGRCVDLLDRLARSFSGEAACDRHCARNLAHQLAEAVTYLVDTMVDVEGWLFHCDAECTWVSPPGFRAVLVSWPSGWEKETACHGTTEEVLQ